MITRYSRPVAAAIWSQETKYKIWFEIEAIVDVPVNVDPANLESALRFWTSSKEARAT